MQFNLIRYYLRDTDVESPEGRQKVGNLTSVVGLISNVFLFTIKLILGFYTGSISILGDSVNNLTDTVSSLVTYISFKISAKPADVEHPFGHARMEYILSSVVALLVLYIGVSLAVESVKKIFNPGELTTGWITIFILVISILVKIFLYFFYGRLEKIIHSDLLRGLSLDSLADIMSTGAILVAMFIHFIWGVNLDAYLGLLVSAIILKSGYEILRDVIDNLLGNPPDEGLVKELMDYIWKYEGVLGVHDIILHDYGPGNKHMTVHVEVNAKDDIMKSHALIDRIEDDLERDYGYKVLIHMDPIIIDDPLINHYKKLVDSFLKRVDEKIQFVDFRMEDEDDKHVLMFDVVLPSTCKDSVGDFKNRFIEEFTTLYPEVELKINVDRNIINGANPE